jgi:hypothetical protein
MLQIFDSVTNACMKLGHDYLPWVAAVILAFTGVAIALRVLARIRLPGDPKQGK